MKQCKIECAWISSMHKHKDQWDTTITVIAWGRVGENVALYLQTYQNYQLIDIMSICGHTNHLSDKKAVENE